MNLQAVRRSRARTASRFGWTSCSDGEAVGSACRDRHRPRCRPLFMVVGILDRCSGTRVIGELPPLGRRWWWVEVTTVVSAASMAGVRWLRGSPARSRRMRPSPTVPSRGEPWCSPPRRRVDAHRGLLGPLLLGRFRRSPPPGGSEERRTPDPDPPGPLRVGPAERGGPGHAGLHTYQTVLAINQMALGATAAGRRTAQPMMMAATPA